MSTTFKVKRLSHSAVAFTYPILEFAQESIAQHLRENGTSTISLHSLYPSNNCTSPEKKARRSTRKWLSPASFEELRRRNMWQEGTCKWFWNSETYQQWLSLDDRRVLWIEGIP